MTIPIDAHQRYIIMSGLTFEWDVFWGKALPNVYASSA
jgi:hypothetical protein